MSYPKPLSEKNILKMYDSAGINDAKKEFLHDFFLAAAKLYGSIDLLTLWKVYQQLAKKIKVVKLLKKDIIAFSEIVRRETVPYYIFEIDEVYSEEQRSDTERFVVLKDIVCEGQGKFRSLWSLHELQVDKDPYIPVNLLDYAEDMITPEQESMLSFIDTLKVTATEYSDKWGNTYPCGPLNKMLKDFEFYNSDERFEIKYLGGEIEGGPKLNEKKLAAFKEDCKGPVSRKIFNQYIRWIKLGWIAPVHSMKILLDNIAETGVQLSEKELEKLIFHINETQNKTNLWCNMGWTPAELTQKALSANSRPFSISFGPGIQKAIKDGLIDMEELKKKFEEKGFYVE